MSARLTIDGLRFARACESLAEELPVSTFDRLRDVLVTDFGHVRYALRGMVEAGRPVLELEIETEVEMTCQRCLEPCRQTVHATNRMPLARDEAELERWEREDPLLDALVAEPRMDVRSLVEDEVLLSLPLAPRHDECGRLQAEI